MALGRTHDKVTRHLNDVGFVCHIQSSGAVGVVITVLGLYPVITLDDKMSAVEKNITARLKEVAVDDQSFAVEVEIACSEIIVFFYFYSIRITN